MGGAVSFGFGGSSSKGSGERRGSGSGPQQLKQLMRSASSRKGFAEALSPEPRLSSDKVEQALLQSTRKRMSESTRNLLQAHSDDEGFIERNAVLAAAAGRRPSWRPSPKSSESPGQSPRGSLADCMQVLRSPRAVEEHEDASPRENDRENEDPRRRSADSSDIAVVVDEAPAKRVPGPSSTPRRRSFVSMGVGEDAQDPEPASPVRDEDLFEPGDRVEDRYVGDVDPVYVEKFVGKGSFGSVFVVRVGDLALEYDVRLAGRRLLRNAPGDALAARSSSPPPEKRPSEKKQRVNYLSATSAGSRRAASSRASRTRSARRPWPRSSGPGATPSSTSTRRCSWACGAAATTATAATAATGSASRPTTTRRARRWTRSSRPRARAARGASAASSSRGASRRCWP